MPCEHNTGSAEHHRYPYYAVMRPVYDYTPEGALQEVIAEWPDNFTADPVHIGMGIYHCPVCGHGKPNDEARAASQRMADAMKRFDEALEKGDMTGFSSTPVERVEEFYIVRPDFDGADEESDEEPG